jgi:hypothetical protein
MLERAGPHPTRDGFLGTIFEAPTTLDISGFPLSFGPRDNAGSHSVFLTRLGESGAFTSLGQATSRQIGPSSRSSSQSQGRLVANA